MYTHAYTVFYTYHAYTAFYTLCRNFAQSHDRKLEGDEAENETTVKALMCYSASGSPPLYIFLLGRTSPLTVTPHE